MKHTHTYPHSIQITTPLHLHHSTPYCKSPFNLILRRDLVDCQVSCWYTKQWDHNWAILGRKSKLGAPGRSPQMSGSLPSEPVRDHLSSFGGCLVCVGALCFTLFLEGNWDISIRGGERFRFTHYYYYSNLYITSQTISHYFPNLPPPSTHHLLPSPTSHHLPLHLPPPPTSFLQAVVLSSKGY